MTTSVTPDRELSEAAFHSKFGYMAGWDEARDMVYEAWQAAPEGTTERTALLALWDAMNVHVRNEKRDAYVREIEK